MAAKIVRQATKIAVLGVPTSAAAMSVGNEGAPAALRAAGLSSGLAKSAIRFQTSATTLPSFTSRMTKVPAREMFPAFWPVSKLKTARGTSRQVRRAAAHS